jgi:FkbM family methyltransferase
VTRLSITERIRVGDRTYRIKGVFANELPLQEIRERFEPWLDTVYQTVLRFREGTFLDVGANFGQTMLKILALDRTRQYVGFEPQPWGCYLIQSFIEENRLKSHTILPLGLSNRNHLARLYIKGGGKDSMASMVENFRPDSFYTSSQYTCVRKGDEVIAELKIPSVSAIKIDVEGGELEVIEGLSDTIREKMPFIIFEVLNHDLAVTGENLDARAVQFREGRTEKMECLLRGQGYEIYNVLSGNILRRVGKIQPAMSADLSNTNYVAVPKLDVGLFLRTFPGTIQDA